MQMDNEVLVVVSGRRDLIAGHIVELQLSAIDTTPLPRWEPGAHIEIVLPSGLLRQYSLSGDPDETFYTVAVLKEPQSRGGSIEVHNDIHLGMELSIKGPKNHFPLVTTDNTVFIAGGIGITPLLSMMRELTKRGQAWELHYAGKSLGSLAYLDKLQLMSGGEVSVYMKDESRRLPVAQILSTIPHNSTVFVCGPESMIDEVEARCVELAIPVRLERFSASSKPKDEIASEEFEVVLSKTNATLTVDPETRLIDAVRTLVPSVPFSCEEGYCGSCETVVLEGIPDHRDTILSPEERAANESMMICVGRSKTKRLVLDL